MRVIIDASLMTDRESAHNHLKESFGFPDYYGRNLDALHDVLSELRDTEIEILQQDHPGNYFEPVYEVLVDVEKEFGGIRILRSGDLEEGAFEAEYAEITEIITEE